ncbi:hypothetical protein E2L08_08400 [Palleronia sediminis]|uniref:Uncharacterized protein n=1 Tax=Palleronia sediminis TaxID=2547833 RepID=A0A4V3B9K9_9RHOB|nr:hypothetical protein [Palleronia sediminis]TDL79619.1 hypothetical protein E2L08_08400 [Palleronia sediminis]
MNSIIFTKVPVQTGETLLHAALARLGAYLDTELGSLETLLQLTGRETAGADIQALHALHLGAHATAADIHHLLTCAQTSLLRLLDVVQTISPRASFERAPSDIDAWLRWSGARLQDICATLSRAIAD